MNSIPQSSGIYRIVCLTTRKIYIGSSLNVLKRWYEHRSDLRRGVHDSPYLQNAWNKYGEDAFAFEVVELVDSAMLIVREQHWLNTLKPFGNQGFNTNEIAGKPPSQKGVKMSAESRAKMSVAKTGKQYSLGRKQSPDEIEKRRIANTGKKRSPEFCARLKEANTGKKHSLESRAKMRDAKLGKPVSENVIEKIVSKTRKVCIFTDREGVEYKVKGLAKFCREHNLSHGAMSEVAIGKRNQHKGWKCRYDK